MPIRGDYHPDALMELPPSAGARVVLPMLDRHDGHANAVYAFSEVRPSSGRWLWHLDRIEEWLPPMSPQERARQFTDAAELPPLTPDGRTDYDAIRARREREWAESEQV